MENITFIPINQILRITPSKEKLLILLENGTILETCEDVTTWDEASSQEPSRLGLKGKFYKYAVISKYH